MILAIIMAIDDDNDRHLILRIYEEYYPTMINVAFKIVHEKSIAEDIAHDTVIKLINNVEVLRTLSENQKQYYVWLTARSISISYYRKNKKNPQYIPLLGYEDDNAPEAVDPVDSIEDNYEQKESFGELHFIIEQLPKKSQDILYYKFYLDYTDKEIAECIGTTANSIHVMISRIKKKIRNIYSKGGKTDE